MIMHGSRSTSSTPATPGSDSGHEVPARNDRQRGTLVFNWWSTTDAGSLRLTQGAGQTMYWGSHPHPSQFRLFAWADGSNSLNWWDLGVDQWTNGNTSNGSQRGRLARPYRRPHHRGPWAVVASVHVDLRLRQIGRTPLSGSCGSTRRPSVSSTSRTSGAIPTLGRIPRRRRTSAANSASPLSTAAQFIRATSSDFETTLGVLACPVRPRRRPLASNRGMGRRLTCRSHAPYGHTWVRCRVHAARWQTAATSSPRFVHFGFEKDRP